jgi:hypothetical protein
MEAQRSGLEAFGANREQATIAIFDKTGTLTASTTPGLDGRDDRNRPRPE